MERAIFRPFSRLSGLRRAAAKCISSRRTNYIFFDTVLLDSHHAETLRYVSMSRSRHTLQDVAAVCQCQNARAAAGSMFFISLHIFFSNINFVIFIQYASYNDQFCEP